MDYEPKTIEEALIELKKILKPYGENQLNITQLTEIYKISLTLSALKKEGITTDNYRTKRRAYYERRKKFFYDYGIVITDNYPFSNPKDLYDTIDAILIKANLNTEQRRIFYYETELRKRTPKKQPLAKSIFSHITKNQVEKLNERSEKEEENWYSLSTVEQDEIIGITLEERQFTEEEQEACEKYYKERTKRKQFLKHMKYIPSD